MSEKLTLCLLIPSSKEDVRTQQHLAPGTGTFNIGCELAWSDSFFIPAIIFVLPRTGSNHLPLLTRSLPIPLGRHIFFCFGSRGVSKSGLTPRMQKQGLAPEHCPSFGDSVGIRLWPKEPHKSPTITRYKSLIVSHPCSLLIACCPPQRDADMQDRVTCYLWKCHIHLSGEK